MIYRKKEEFDLIVNTIIETLPKQTNAYAFTLTSVNRNKNQMEYDVLIRETQSTYSFSVKIKLNDDGYGLRVENLEGLNQDVADDIRTFFECDCSLAISEIINFG